MYGYYFFNELPCNCHFHIFIERIKNRVRVHIATQRFGRTYPSFLIPPPPRPADRIARSNLEKERDVDNEDNAVYFIKQKYNNQGNPPPRELNPCREISCPSERNPFVLGEISMESYCLIKISYTPI